jgi:hypothetical protein
VIVFNFNYVITASCVAVLQFLQAVTINISVVLLPMIHSLRPDQSYSTRGMLIALLVNLLHPRAKEFVGVYKGQWCIGWSFYVIGSAVNFLGSANSRPSDLKSTDTSSCKVK